MSGKRGENLNDDIFEVDIIFVEISGYIFKNMTGIKIQLQRMFIRVLFTTSVMKTAR